MKKFETERVYINADGDFEIELSKEGDKPDGVFINSGVLDSAWPEDCASVWLDPDNLRTTIKVLRQALKRIEEGK